MWLVGTPFDIVASCNPVHQGIELLHEGMLFLVVGLVYNGLDWDGVAGFVSAGDRCLLSHQIHWLSSVP